MPHFNTLPEMMAAVKQSPGSHYPWTNDSVMRLSAPQL